MSGKIELRMDLQGDLDEIVVSDTGLVHVERMSDHAIWMAIHPDNSGLRLIVNFCAVIGSDGKPRIEMFAEEDGEQDV